MVTITGYESSRFPPRPRFAHQAVEAVKASFQHADAPHHLDADHVSMLISLLFYSGDFAGVIDVSVCLFFFFGV